MAFGVVVTAGWVAMTLALAELPPHPFWGPVYVNGIGFAVGLAFAALLGWRRRIGLDHLRGGLWVVPLALLSATQAWPGVRGSLDEAVILVFVGLNEELWSRGIVLAGLRRLGPYGCATCVGVLFGLQHLINLRWGQPLDDTAVQIVEAGGFGFALAALRIRGVALWWLILLHAFADYVSIMSPGAAPAWQQVAQTLIEIGYGLAVLRLTAGVLQRDDPVPGAA
jgi:hypothetical protein